jgi:hypothetical protein
MQALQFHLGPVAHPRLQDLSFLGTPSPSLGSHHLDNPPTI